MGETTSSGRSGERLIYIDGLRGVAALMVLLFHFFNNTPYKELWQRFLPDAVWWLLGKGWMGVEIFFVISGFVIAHALSHDRITGKYALVFLVRRSIRLDPPYWATIASWVVLTWLSNILLPMRALSFPSFGQVVSHLFYLQNILGYGDIVPVFWTLCLELQFYTLYIFLLLLMVSGGHAVPGCGKRWLYRAGMVGFVLVTLLSWLSAVADYPDSSWKTVWFPGSWFYFAMGVMGAWSLSDPKRSRFFSVYSALVVGGLMGRWGYATALAILTAVSIVLAARWGTMGTWLGGRFIQYCGKLSYSIYLIHFVVGLRVINYGYRLFGEGVGAALLATIIGGVATFIAAHVLHKAVEAPSMRLAKRVKKLFGT